MLVSVFLITPVYAQGDSISTAIKIVKDFNAKVKGLTDELEYKKEITVYRDISSDRTEKVITELKDLRWVQGPGRSRAKRTYRIVELHIQDQIDSFVELIVKPHPEDKRLKEVVGELVSTKDKALAELKKAFQAEVIEKERIKPVPLIDRSPFEKQREGESGMWDR